MPGQIDAHTHMMFDTVPPMAPLTSDIGYIKVAAVKGANDMLMHGFTSARAMGGPVFGLKKGIDQGPGARVAKMLNTHDGTTMQTLRRGRLAAAASLSAAAILAMPVLAQPSDVELAKKLANPVAALISVPLQLNYDSGIGPANEGKRWLLNIQPVVPMDLSEDWNLISRTILPVVWQSDIVPGAGSQSGLGDIVQSLFFSPKVPTAGGWIWGAGAVLLLPTASNDLLGADKWGAGPTGVALKQDGPWTYGVLANHIWSFAGNDNRADISATFVQPFVTYTTPDAVSYFLNTESTYDWNSKQWVVPINAGVSKVLKLGNQLVSIGGALRYWADGPDSGPSGLGFRLIVTLLFPK